MIELESSSAEETERCCATPWQWGDPAPGVRAIVTQTGDPQFLSLDFDWFPRLELLYDGRNSMRGVALPGGVSYQGVGVSRP